MGRLRLQCMFVALLSIGIPFCECYVMVKNDYAWLPKLPVVASFLDKSSTQVCREQADTFVHDLRKFSAWAVQMLDSSANHPSGILAGNSYQLGNFDECVDVGEDFNGKNIIKGQYCLLDLTIHHRKHAPFNTTLITKPNSARQTAWERIIYNGDPRLARRDQLKWAVCLPSACLNPDIALALNRSLTAIATKATLGPDATDVFISGAIANNACQSRSKNRMVFSPGDITYCFFIGLLIALVVVSTAVDLLYPEKKNPSKVVSRNTDINAYANFLMCFSASRNIKYLTRGRLSGSGFDCIHGLRLMFMVLAIAGHRFLVTFSGPILNAKIGEAGYHSPLNMFIMNGMIVVDSFFVYSGLLTAFYLPIELDRRRLNPLMVWVYRFVRLTPVYLAVVLFHATILDKLGWGPLWPEVVTVEATRCAKNWWLNILYLNNYIRVNEMCMFQTWYLSVDTHWFMISVLMVYALWRWRVFGYALLAIISFISIAIPFGVTYLGNKDALMLLYPGITHDLVGSSEYFQTMYAASHIRGGPYMVGIATGYLLYKIRHKNLNISKTQAYCGYLIVILLCIGAQFLGFFFYDPTRKVNKWIGASYAALHRTIWGVGIALNVFLLVHVRIDWLHKLLTWSPWVPLSRLTYCAYLVHTVAHLYEVGNLRAPLHLSYYTGAWMFAGDMLFTFSVSLAVCLCIEAPFRAIEKLVFGDRNKSEDNIEMQSVPRYSTNL